MWTSSSYGAARPAGVVREKTPLALQVLGGFNPAALVAVAAGSLAYFLLLNPLTYDQAHVFRFVSASIPAFLVAALAYVLLTKLVVQPLWKGGYGAVTKKEEANNTEAGRPVSD